MNRTVMRRAFTLIEVLIAIALALILGATMFAFLHDMLATRARTLEHAARQRAAATLIERLEGDLATCVVGDSRDGAGVRGDALSLSLLTRGVMPQLASRGIEDPASISDLHAVEYRFNEGARAIEARKRRAGASSEFVALGNGVAHLRFRYLDGRQWRSDFDSIALNRLPNAVEVCVWFNPWPSDAAASQTPSTRNDARDEAAQDAGGRTPSFEEDAVAAMSEMSDDRPPPPDRRRVIVIPDGGRDQEAEAAGDA